MEGLIAQAKSLVTSADEAGKKQLLDSFRNLSYALETPQDTVARICYSQQLLPLVRVGADLKLFKTLSEATGPLTVAEISAKTPQPSALFLGRLLRYYASQSLIVETDKDTFDANAITKTLSEPGFEAGIYHAQDTISPCFSVLPDYLEDTNYADINDFSNTTFQKAHNTPLPAFAWLPSQPRKFETFNKWAMASRDGMPSWFDKYPARDLLSGREPDQPLFVDVGGGIGHQCVAIRDRFPQLQGRVILQDIPQMLPHAIPHPDVEQIPQDFWQEQAIKGSKVYYLRNIMHDYPDSKCVTILQNTAAALAPDSVILVDDMVVPNRGAHWQTTQLDVMVMTTLGAIERTTEQWYDLIEEQAGLKIKSIVTYTDSLRDSVIEITK